MFAELGRRHVAETRAASLAILSKQRGKGLASTVRAMVEAGIAAHRVEPRLHRILTGESPRLAIGHIEAPTDEAMRAEEQSFVASMQGTLADPELAVWIVKTAVHALVHKAVIERPRDLSRPLLVDEITELVVRYLRRRPITKKKKSP